MKQTLFFLILSATLMSCGGKTGQGEKAADTTEMEEASKGVGPFQNVTVSEPLMASMVARGQALYETKCSPCHLLTADMVVGPGWKGVTERRTPEWIMNMITNVDVMLDNDPEAQKLLEKCFTRMPNDNVPAGDARDILEFMYANDGRAVGK